MGAHWLVAIAKSSLYSSVPTCLSLCCYLPSHRMQNGLSIPFIYHTIYISHSLIHMWHIPCEWQDPFSKSLKSYPLKFYMHLHSYMQRWPRLSLLQNFTFIRRVYQPKWPLYWDSSRLCWYNISEKKKKNCLKVKE